MRKVRGTFIGTSLSALPALVVCAFDRDMRHVELLGKATPDLKGVFEIEYSAKQFRRAEKGRADLFVQVLDAKGRLVWESQTRYNAEDDEHFEIELAAEALRLDDEWTANRMLIAGPVENVPIPELRDDDLDFLHRETGIDPDRLRFLRIDATWAEQHDLPLAFSYGLLRRGLPDSLPRLSTQSPERWRRAAEEAIAERIVPGSLRKLLGGALGRLEDLADELASQGTDGPMPEVSLLGVTAFSMDQQRAFARALRRRGELDDELWSELSTSKVFGPEAVSDARFVLAAAPLMHSHPRTVQAFDEYRRQRGFKEAADIARMSRQDWQGVVAAVGDELPPGVGDAEQLVATIAHHVDRAFPTLVVAHGFARDGGAELADVARFLLENPHFDLLSSRPTLDGPDGENGTGELAVRLARVVRVARVLASGDAYPAAESGLAGGIRALLDEGFHSAREVRRAGKARFVETMAPALGEAAAAATFETALARADTVEMLGQGLRDYARDPVGVVPSLPWGEPPEDWSFLFEGSGGCACRHCRSVLGPAAYLADLLHALETSPSSPYDVLTAASRRPDLPALELSCANANTPLPYIDLVNEILGDALVDGEIRPRETSGTADERRAAPEHLRTDADERLSSSSFPWTLPFEGGHEEAVAWARHLALDLAEMRRLVEPAAPDLARFELGVGPELWQLLARPAIETENSDVWPGTASSLRSVPELLAATGLDYAELAALTRLWFFSAEGAGELEVDEHGDPCDPSAHTVDGLGPEVLDQLHRFVRLSRHLGWPITEESELDAALEASGAARFSAEVLGSLAAMRRAAGILRRSVRELMAPETSLARVLGLDELELELLRELSGRAGSSAMADRLALIEHGLAIRASGLAIRELANGLLGWDPTPSAFYPADDEATAFLLELRRDHEAELEERLLAAGSDPEALAAAEGVPEVDREDFFRAFYGRQRMVSSLSQQLGLEAELLDRLIHAPEGGASLTAADRTRSAIEDFMAFASLPAAGEPDPREPTLLATAAGTLRRTARLARLVTRLGLGTAEVDGLFRADRASGLLDLDLGPALLPDPDAARRLAQLLAVSRAVALSRSLPASTSVFSLLVQAGPWHEGEDLADADAFAELERATGWPRGHIARTLGALGLANVEALGRFDTYERLAAILALCRRFAAEPEEVLAWGSGSSPSAAAAGLRRAAERGARDVEAWRAVLAPINDRLREARRDALLARLRYTRGFRSSAEIYARYLIDPDMTACQLTSRVKQANASVQLFIQRLLMGLEEVDLTFDVREHWQRWQWMKSYRVWEANRKVFLFPENWIHSELRSDKSPPFLALENELLQDDVTAETAEAAYFGYLDQLDEVSRLDIRAIYFEREDGRLVEGMHGELGPGTLHVFGRTRSSPHLYYYRWRDHSLVWGAWQKIDLPIEGDHLVPFAREGRLVLAWIAFRESQEGRATLWHPEISWSERRSGTWTATRSTETPDDWLPNRIFSPSRRQFRLEEREGRLFIQAYFSTGVDFGGNSRTSVPDRDQILLYEPGDRRIVVTSRESSGIGALLPPGTLGEGNQAAVAPVRSDGSLRILVNPHPEAVDRTYSLPILEHIPGDFRVTPGHQQASFALGSHFAFETEKRVYLASPRLLTVEWGFGGMPGTELDVVAYDFEHLYHPYVPEIGEALYVGGPARLLAPERTRAGASLDRQLLAEPVGEVLFPRLGPSGLVSEPHPYEQIDFSAEGAYSLYNWELFFHIPLLIAERLSQNQRFEQARQWLHYIFDPTDGSSGIGLQRFWRTKPFYLRAMRPIETVDALLEALASGDLEVEDQIEAWKADPFDPHLLARHRPLAYMRAVVMKYIENLVAWGDELFAVDTIESLNEATQLYVLAAEILGDDKPTLEAPEREARSYRELGELDAFANALEEALPAGTTRSSTGGIPHRGLYFCIPPNDKLSALRGTIADRLTKIRTCLDIEGRFRRLPLYEPPIDPGLLVRARAAGLDMHDVLATAGETAVPHRRYVALAARAAELCQDVRALGAALSSALERRDGEELARLRSRHENVLLERQGEIKSRQIEEARESLEALRTSLRAAEIRKARLEAWAEEYRNPSEQAQIDHLHVAHGFEVASQAFQVAASIAHLLPDLKAGLDAGTIWGGSFVGNSARAASAALGIISGQFAFEATMSSIEGAHARRKGEWLHQAEIAELELQQLERQIVAAEIRLAITEADERHHQMRLGQTREVDSFLRRKFSNQELYAWMVGQLSELYRGSYRMARDLALRAQRAARHELGLASEDLRIVGLDHWDGLRRGLLAGEKLHHDLRRLEAAYADRDRRELEITKHISLARLHPEQLIALRETGACVFALPELLFDLDFPGHFRRRIKSVSLSIPAVSGPTTSVSAVLKLVRSWVRISTDDSSPYRRPVAGDERFLSVNAAQQSIATSSANRDGGMFQLDFRDPRYLPFEGAGVDSEWQLELPAAIRPFDYDTISDVLLHISYTASEGPPDFRDHVEAQVEESLGSWLEQVSGSGEGLVRVLRMRTELSTELHQFLNPAAGASLHRTSIRLGPKYLPHLLRPYLDDRPGRAVLQVTGAVVALDLSQPGIGAAPVRFGPESSVDSAPLTVTDLWGGLCHAIFPPTDSYAEPFSQEWTLELDPAGLPADLTEEHEGALRLGEGVVEDIYIAIFFRLLPGLS